MRKNRTMRVAALLLALTLITSCFVGGTFAKYATTTDAATGTATAAAWLSADLSGDATVDSYTKVSAKKMAPGTSGTITITPAVTGTPEVDWTLSITGSATATGTVPDTLKFKVNDSAAKTFDELNTWLATGVTQDGSAGTTVDYKDPITIDWEWSYTGDDTDDTVDTAFAGKSITVSMTLAAEQVQPVAAAGTP